MRPGWPWRRLTWSRRVLPDVIIPGVQKCGTSSLFAWMTQHPDVYGSIPKEVHYFDGGRAAARDDWPLPESWYRAHFPTLDCVAEGIAIEATPRYMLHPAAAERIAETVPQVRLIVLLRNPVERAISHYFHQKKRRREPLNLLDALHAEQKRVGLRDDGSYPIDQDAWIHGSYMLRGMYADQLQRLYASIDRERILVLESDRMFADPGPALRRVFEFSGVRSDVVPADLSPRMVGKRSDVDPGVRQYLRRVFEEPNHRLYELLGEDYGW